MAWTVDVAGAALLVVPWTLDVAGASLQTPAQAGAPVAAPLAGAVVSKAAGSAPVIERPRFEDAGQQRFADRVRDLLHVKFNPNAPGRALTQADLVRAGVLAPDGSPMPAPVPEPPDADAQPTAPTGFKGTGAATVNILEWDAPTTAGYAYSELWAAGVDNLGAAVRIQTPSARVAADRVGAPGVTKYYWLRHISRAGKIGPYHAVGGLAVTSGSATGAAAQAAFDELIVARGLIVEALIGDAEIGGAKIRDASIESAKITSLSADKITTGAIQVGRAIASANYVPGAQGWGINGNGAAEFMSVRVRGDVEASSVAASVAISAPLITGGSVDGAIVRGGEVQVGYAPAAGDVFGMLRSRSKPFWFDANRGFAIGHNANYQGGGGQYTFAEFYGGAANLFRWWADHQGGGAIEIATPNFRVNADGSMSCTSATIAGNVTANALTANSVTTASIVTGAVTAGTIAASAVTTPAIAQAAVTTPTIALNAVTSAPVGEYPSDHVGTVQRFVPSYEYVIAEAVVDGQGQPVVLFWSSPDGPAVAQAAHAENDNNRWTTAQWIVRAINGAGGVTDLRTLRDTGLVPTTVGLGVSELPTLVALIVPPAGPHTIRIVGRIFATGGNGVLEGTLSTNPLTGSYIMARGKSLILTLAIKR